MATTCCRPHLNILDKCSICVHPNHNLLTNCRAFKKFNNTLYIIDYSRYYKYCKACGRELIIYLYTDQLTVRASFDGVTDLSLLACRNDIIITRYCDLFTESRFGKFIYVYASSSTSVERACILYFLNDHVKLKMGEILVNDILTICCETVSGEILLIDLNGKVIEANYIYSEPGSVYRFEIGNNRLLATLNFTDYSILKWEYISLPALNTKSAAASARADDE
jgi:hypothetical protein